VRLFKHQIQALDRTQPGLPMKKECAGTMTRNYNRHGVHLFAALDVLAGKATRRCMKRHRHRGFIHFLNLIDAMVSKRKTMHVILNDYATHTVSQRRGTDGKTSALRISLLSNVGLLRQSSVR
jgi:hypothetical protein